MIKFLDTSVLIPVFDSGHVHHRESLSLFQSLGPPESNETYCSLHSLAEFYAAVTRMPSPHRMEPEDACLAIDQVLARVNTVAMNPSDYDVVLRGTRTSGNIGGMIYDALLLQCARKVNADVIFTWNVKHFQRLALDLASRIRTP